MFNMQDAQRNAYMLRRRLRKKGYDWWWHNLTAKNEETGEEKAFFFEFFLCNPSQGDTKPIFGQLPENRELRIQPSYLMVKAGCWGEDKCQLHRFFGMKKIKLHAHPYRIQAGDCYLDNTRLQGSIHVTPEEAYDHPEWMCDHGNLEWDLRMNKQIAFNVGYGTNLLFRALNAFEMYWHAEGMKTSYEGIIIYNGERYIVEPETSYGYADKNWGADFTSPWVWLSSNHLTGQNGPLKNSVFDIGGGRPKVFGIPLNRKLLGALYYEGKEYEFNFSKFWTFTRTRFYSKETDKEIIWMVKQENLTAVMETTITCQKKDMILVNYEAPNGEKKHNRLWNGGTGVGTIKLYRKSRGRRYLVDSITAENVGCEYGEYC